VKSGVAPRIPPHLRPDPVHPLRPLARGSPSGPMSPTLPMSMADTACAASDLFLGVRAVHATPTTPPPPYKGRAVEPCTPCASIRCAPRLAPLAGANRTTIARSSTRRRSIRRVQQSLDHSTTTRCSRISSRTLSATSRHTEVHRSAAAPCRSGRPPWPIAGLSFFDSARLRLHLPLVSTPMWFPHLLHPMCPSPEP
jgi:hypothetical protein